MWSLRGPSAERVFEIKDGKNQGMLEPGVYRYLQVGRYEKIYINIINDIAETTWRDILIKNYPKIVEKNIEIVAFADYQVAVVSLNNKLFKVFGPGEKACQT